MVEEFEEIKMRVSNAEADLSKAHAGSGAAGTRFRAELQAVIRLCQSLRKQTIARRTAARQQPE